MKAKEPTAGCGNHRELRNALACFCTGVAVITTRTIGGGHAGVTVNSFSSVSLDPPLVLFCLVRTANVLQNFLIEEQFTVNFLHHNQQYLSNMFARPSAAEWNSVPFSLGEHRCALISGSLGHLECEKISELDGGDHVIFMGRVLRFHASDAKDPLLFYRGSYGTFHPDSKVNAYQSAPCFPVDISGWG
jgi:flavin reductase (DIM6/NTAB) family NADH-FMN oxidoreductase RutF